MWSRPFERGNEVSGAAVPRLRMARDGGADDMPVDLAPSTEAPSSADHHLWRNGRLWWVAFTIHLPPWQKERVRLSLGTDDLAEARRRRDELLRRYPQERGCTLSLRCVPPAAAVKPLAAARAATRRARRSRAFDAPAHPEVWRRGAPRSSLKAASA